MAEVYLGIGSNIEPHRYVALGLEALAQQFGALQLSSVYESEAVGFAGDNFLNLVVAVSTELGLAELSRCLKALEDRHGCDRSAGKYSGRTLDIDILTYDELVGVHEGIELPRAEVLSNAFVLRPLAELAPSRRHPIDGRTYAQLWQAYRGNQRLWPVDYCWRGQLVSRADCAGD